MKLNDKKVDELFPHYSFNARLLIKEMVRRGITIEEYGPRYYYTATLGKHKQVFFDIMPASISAPMGILFDDKFKTKQLLEYFSIPVADGEVFHKKEQEKAVQYAQKIGFPVVLKPTYGSHGNFVFVQIEREQELSDKILFYTKNYKEDDFFLIEKYISKNEYRLFITKDNFFAAVQRIPPIIVGDGKHTIKHLIESENYRRMNPRNTCLCRIPTDNETKRILQKQHKFFNTVLKINEKTIIRLNSNVSTGATCVDVTESVHPYFISLSKKILNLVDNVPFIGIDVLSNSIATPDTSCVICEINLIPGLSLHMMPSHGVKRDVANAIVNVIFPESK